MTKIIKIKTAACAYALIIFALGLPLCTSAQDAQVLSPITAGGITFERYLFSSGSISYCNVKYVETEIMTNYPPIAWNNGEKLSIKILTHDLFVQAVRESFSSERFSLLVGNNEEIYLHFVLSNTGKLLSLAFILKSDSKITTTEIAALEVNLVRQLSFQPYDVNLSGPARRHINIFFNMSEVQAGEVKEVRFYSK